MVNFSVRAHLSEGHGVTVGRDGRFDCPSCGHRTGSVSKDDRLAKCFHSACGWVLHQGNANPHKAPLQKIAWEIMSQCHKALISQMPNRATGDRSVWLYLLSRQVHETVVKNSPTLGVVPDTLDVDAIAKPYREWVGREEKKKDDKVEALKEFDATISDIKEKLRKARGWLVFAHTTASQKICSFKLRQPNEKRFSTCKIEPWRKGVFCPIPFDVARNPLEPLIVAEGEFDILHLQSVLAHNEQRFCDAVALGGSSGDNLSALNAFREQVND